MPPASNLSNLAQEGSDPPLCPGCPARPRGLLNPPRTFYRRTLRFFAAGFLAVFFFAFAFAFTAALAIAKSLSLLRSNQFEHHHDEQIQIIC